MNTENTSESKPCDAKLKQHYSFLLSCTPRRQKAARQSAAQRTRHPHSWDWTNIIAHDTIQGGSAPFAVWSAKHPEGRVHAVTLSLAARTSAACISCNCFVVTALLEHFGATRGVSFPHGDVTLPHSEYTRWGGQRYQGSEDRSVLHDQSLWCLDRFLVRFLNQYGEQMETLTVIFAGL